MNIERETFRRIYEELKLKTDKSSVQLCAILGLDHRYISKQLTGKAPISRKNYTKIVRYAMEQGIDTTQYNTMYKMDVMGAAEPISQLHTGLGPLNGVVNIKVRIINNDIAGIDFEVVKT